MPTSLSFEDHGEGIGAAWTVLRDNAARAGLAAAVPTCPGWTVADLVAHQGMVHRWATAAVRGNVEDVEDTRAVEREGLAAPDPLAWLDDGATALLSALAFAPDDLETFFFLKDAPPPKFAWARRQCHETTVHAVDAMSAALGRPPTASETWIRPELAQDGVDELLCGFVPRSRQRLRSPEPLTVVVQATDTGASWTMRITQDPVVTTPGNVADDGESGSRHTGRVLELTGTAAQLYLGLWNRGDEVRTDAPEFLPLWREQMTVPP